MVEWRLSALFLAGLLPISVFLFWILCRKNRRISKQRIESRMLFDYSNDAVLKVDCTGKIRKINIAGEKMFGYQQGALVGKNISCLIALTREKAADEKIIQALRVSGPKAPPDQASVNCRHQDGSVFPATLTVTRPITGGAEGFYMAIFRDLSMEKSLESALAAVKDRLDKSNSRMKYLMQYEGLTEIADRDLFNRRLEDELKRARRENADVSLIICDVDYLKPLTDMKGSVAAQDILKKVAEVIHGQIFRSVDLFARYGGETFSVILPATPLEGALTVAGRIQQALQKENIANPASYTSDRLTLSMGVTAVQPEDNYAPEPLIERADQALFLAKNKGRNRIEQMK